MRALLFICSIACVYSCGCSGETTPLRGVVLTSVDVDKSYILGNFDGARQVDVPVPGAKVRLFLDKQLSKPAGLAVVSDANGEYTLETKGMPRPEEQDGSFFLRVEKEGYEPLTCSVAIGPYSRYSHHAAYLRDLGK